MCGIAGFSGALARRDDAAQRLAAMTHALAHRGPDGDGAFVDAEAGIALGHRRLAIIDLSGGGRQPMASPGGRFIVTFNGEIYNYLELRAELLAAGVVLKSQSDTEVFLAFAERFGLDSFLKRAEGMFAFALWDREARALILARDHAGIKPLFWTRSGNGIAFASELKAFRALPDWVPEIDRGSLALYLRFGYVPAPRSIYRGVHKIEPGTYLVIGAGGNMRSARHWNLAEAAASRAEEAEKFSDADATNAVEDAVRRSVAREMVADVPVGCFLSGGIDSSLVAHFMRQAAPGKVKTFSIGFDDPRIDESGAAAAVASYIGTEHHTLRLGPADGARVLEKLSVIYDEPLGDMAQIPVFLVSELARRHVTVALGGDGGDEAFAGYDRYFKGAAVNRLARLPWPLPEIIRYAVSGPLDSISAFAMRAAGLAPDLPMARAKLARFAGTLAQKRPVDAYRAMCSLWPNAAEIAGHAEPPVAAYEELAGSSLHPLDLFQRIDCATYLPDAMMAKLDRASMAAGLEGRVPLMSRELMSLGLALPQRFRVRDGIGKWVLREVLYRNVDRKLVDRPKQGFGVPMAAWLRGPMRAWADDRLGRDAILSAGLFAPEQIVAKWREHCEGRADWSYPLWAALVAQDWARQGKTG